MKGIEIEVMYNNKKLAYVFKRDDKHYGKTVDLKTRSIKDIADATWLLLQNALETIELLEAQK